MSEKDFNNYGIQHLNALGEFVAHYENIIEANEKTKIPINKLL